MKQKLKMIVSIIVDGLPLILFAVTALVVYMTCCTNVRYYSDTVFDVSDGWVSSSGEAVSLSSLPTGDISVTHSLSEFDCDNKRLCFISTHTYVKAEYDGELVYDYAPSQVKILGKSYGMYIHLIPIPKGASFVTLKLYPIYKNSPASIKDVAIEDAGVFIAEIFHKGLPIFALCMMISLYGVLMVILGIPTLFLSHDNNINFFSLGEFAILVGLWATNETMILQVYTQHPEVIRYITYLCLVCVAYPPVSFLASATNQRNLAFLPIILILTIVNFILNTVFTSLGFFDIRDLLLFSHINIAIALFAVIFMLVRAKKMKTINPLLLKTIILGMTPAVIGVILDLVHFRVFPNSNFDASFFTKIGVGVFSLVMGIYFLRARMELAVEQGRAELMKKMAYTDGLTSLANRTAFQDKEDEIRNSRIKCIIVQLDINFLKKVNDVYGHTEGDRQIIGAARIIRDCFADIGTSYRTGGDEFIVVVQNGWINEVEDALRNLETLVDEYNEREIPPVPLQIAYGYAPCTMKSDILDEAELLADQRMYEKKKAMKVKKWDKGMLKESDQDFIENTDTAST